MRVLKENQAKQQKIVQNLNWIVIKLFVDT